MHGWTVIVTRPRVQGEAMMNAIATAGGEPWIQPLIETTPWLNSESVAVLEEWSSYDAVVFTSANAIRSLHEIAIQTGISWPVDGPACYVIGKATGKEAGVLGLQPLDIGNARTQADLGEALVEKFRGRSMRVLCPSGDKADTALARGLQAAGHHVTRCICYKTTDCLIDVIAWQRIFSRGRVGLLFYSPSAVHSLIRQWDDAARLFPCEGFVVCVGPTTAEAAKMKFREVVEAPRPDQVLDALAQAIRSLRG